MVALGPLGVSFAVLVAALVGVLLQWRGSGTARGRTLAVPERMPFTRWA